LIDATFLTAGGSAALSCGQDRDAFLAPHLQAVQAHTKEKFDVGIS
jgi:FMN-dependent NADH-azoreductase